MKKVLAKCNNCNAVKWMLKTRGGIRCTRDGRHCGTMRIVRYPEIEYPELVY